MICLKCNKEFQDTAKFCPHCGTQVQNNIPIVNVNTQPTNFVPPNNQPIVVGEQPINSNSIPNIPTNVPNGSQNTYFNGTPHTQVPPVIEEKDNTKGIVIGVIITLVTLLLCCCCGFFGTMIFSFS